MFDSWDISKWQIILMVISMHIVALSKLYPRTMLGSKPLFITRSRERIPVSIKPPKKQAMWTSKLAAMIEQQTRKFSPQERLSRRDQQGELATRMSIRPPPPTGLGTKVAILNTRWRRGFEMSIMVEAAAATRASTVVDRKSISSNSIISMFGLQFTI
ncbi:hypothetical protein DITRI_Ditri14bG0105200 [Diplodiscus trichospermus]